MGLGSVRVGACFERQGVRKGRRRDRKWSHFYESGYGWVIAQLYNIEELTSLNLIAKLIHQQMIRQSQIVNFLDLIKHITESRNFKNSNAPAKSKKKSRYDETEEDGENEQNERKLGRSQKGVAEAAEGKDGGTEFQHKMLKITHEIKRKPRSFKLDSFQGQKFHSQSQIELGNKMSQFRSNLYENYCQMIQRKRQQKINRMFHNSNQDLNHKINISDTVHFDSSTNSSNNRRSFKETPFIKSKTLKPGFESVKIRQHEKSRKKMQPSELNIGQVKAVKMPRLGGQNQPLGNRRLEFRVEKYGADRRKNAVINKIGSLEGWVYEEDKNTFNIDYF